MPQLHPWGSSFGLLGQDPSGGGNVPVYGDIGPNPWMQPEGVAAATANAQKTALFPYQQQEAELNLAQGRQKFDFLKGILGNINNALGPPGRFGGGGGFGLGAGFGPPAFQSFAPSGPIWNQGQINAQANLQRGNLNQQAGTEARQAQENFANRGFSPVGSPFLNYAQQNAMLKANAAAASNETNLNFNAAKANRDAELEAAKMNAASYGNWLNALMQGQGFQIQEQRTQQDFLTNLLNSVRGF